MSGHGERLQEHVLGHMCGVGDEEVADVAFLQLDRSELPSVSVLVQHRQDEPNGSGVDLLEVARDEWCTFDDTRRSDYPDYIEGYMEDDIDTIDVMDFTLGEVDQLVHICESNEQDWWEECDIEITPDEFRQFLFDNLEAFDVGLITELNALIAAREST